MCCVKNSYCQIIYITNCKSKIPLALQYANVQSKFTLNYSHSLSSLDSKQERKWKSTVQELKEKRKCRNFNQICMIHVASIANFWFQAFKKRNFKDPSNYVQVICLIRQLNHSTGLRFPQFRSLLLLHGYVCSV